MPAVVDQMPMAKIVGDADGNWVQPIETVVDVSGYTEAAFVLTVQGMTRPSGTLSVLLDTAIENREEQYVPFATLVEYSSTPGEFPVSSYVYLQGSSTGGSSAPGFARYLRIRVTGVTGWDLILGVRALFKP